MISSMIGRRVEVFEPLVVGDDSFDYTSGMTKASAGQHRKWNKGDAKDSAAISFEFYTEKDGELYFHLPSEYPRDTLVRIKVEHEDGTTAATRSFNYLTNETHTMYCLGTFRAGDLVKLEVVLKDSSGNLYYYKNTGYVYYFNEETFEEAYKELTASLSEITAFTDTNIKATVNMAKGDNMMFTSIPFDKGWTVKVDGKTVKLSDEVKDDDDEYSAKNKVFGALLAFEVPEGEHTIELSFVPRGFTVGGILALIGLTVVGITLVKTILRDRKRRRSKLAAFRAAAAQASAPADESADELTELDKIQDEEDPAELDDLGRLDGGTPDDIKEEE
jgi:uncharacterized membrane protein YfhO